MTGGFHKALAIGGFAFVGGTIGALGGPAGIAAGAAVGVGMAKVAMKRNDEEKERRKKEKRDREERLERENEAREERRRAKKRKRQLKGKTSGQDLKKYDYLYGTQGIKKANLLVAAAYNDDWFDTCLDYT